MKLVFAALKPTPRRPGRLLALSTLVLLASFGLTGDASARAARPPRVGGRAADFTLADLVGEKVRLSRVARTGPVVLVVLRGYPGYQCPYCTRQVGELIGQSEAFAAAGATVLLVYPGPAEGLTPRAAEFAPGSEFPRHFRLLVDPGYAFTNAYGLRWEAESETAYPATFIIDSGRIVRFARVSRTHGERTPVTDVLAALRKL